MGTECCCVADMLGPAPGQNALVVSLPSTQGRGFVVTGAELACAAVQDAVAQAHVQDPGKWTWQSAEIFLPQY